MHLLTLFCLANAVGSVLRFFFYAPPSAKQFSMNLSWALVSFPFIFPPHDHNQVLSLISLPAFGSANCALQRVPQAPRHSPSGMLFNLNPVLLAAVAAPHTPLSLSLPISAAVCAVAIMLRLVSSRPHGHRHAAASQTPSPAPPAPHLRIQIGHRTPKAWGRHISVAACRDSAG